jgi:hypothetical protein
MSARGTTRCWSMERHSTPSAQRLARPSVEWLVAMPLVSECGGYVAWHHQSGALRQSAFRAGARARLARPGCVTLDLERVMKPARSLPRIASPDAAPLHSVVLPSCRKSPHEQREQSAEGAGQAEGKIEGDGTARPCSRGLHKGGRGTRWGVRRAAFTPRTAPMFAKPRAACAPVLPTAPELDTCLSVVRFRPARSNALASAMCRSIRRNPSTHRLPR